MPSFYPDLYAFLIYFSCTGLYKLRRIFVISLEIVLVCEGFNHRDDFLINQAYFLGFFKTILSHLIQFIEKSVSFTTFFYDL